MQIELLKKPLKSYRTIEVRETEEMLENSIIVPDSKPDIKEVFLSDAESFVTSVEKSGRMVEVSGEIRYRIMYSADTPDQRVETIVTRYPWSFSIQKPKTETEAEINIFARSRSQHTEITLINGRKIVARTVFSLNCRFYEIRTDEIGREILGENVYLKSTPVNVVSLADNGNSVSRVSNVLSLPHASPAIKEILFSRVNLGPAELSYGENEPYLEAKGTAYILYRSDTIDEGIESVVLQFPVKMETGVESISGAKLLSTSAVKGWEIEPVEDNDGLHTQVSITLEVEVDTQILVAEEQIIIEDAYAIGNKLELKKTQMNVISDELELTNTQDLKHRIKLDDPERQLSEVLMVSANERSIASRQEDGNIYVQGTLGVDVVYLSSSREVGTVSIELPFNQTFSLPDHGLWNVIQVVYNIDDVTFDISGNDTVEIIVTYTVKLRIARIEEVICTDSISVGVEEVRKKAPVVLYHTQPEDTVWSIAKKYRIPVSRLALDNAVDASSKLETGKKIFIM